jgi:hypothetical protein
MSSDWRNGNWRNAMNQRPFLSFSSLKVAGGELGHNNPFVPINSDSHHGVMLLRAVHACLYGTGSD